MSWSGEQRRLLVETNIQGKSSILNGDTFDDLPSVLGSVSRRALSASGDTAARGEVTLDTL
jgi:hypothetical protein